VTPVENSDESEDNEQMVNVAVLGYGTVGSGVVEVINTNHDSINKKTGDEINIKYVLDLRDFPGDPVEKILVHDFNTIVNDPEVDIVVETMGGVHPAYDFTKQALLAGKSVCTSNKELVASHGTELMQIAEDKQINYLFEASCGGGIPIIRPLNSSLTADEIDQITGILNGTTNYILTKMTRDGSEFEDALVEAQNNGYAERNPEADIEGHDACRKIAILSSLAYGHHVNFEDIYTEGITKITATDIKYAQEIGAAIKLLGTSCKTENGFYAMVTPGMIDPTSPLYSVNGVFNAIFVHGNVLGDAMFYGSGAGKLPTASAVVADVVDAARHLHRNIMQNWSSHSLELKDISEMENRFFVRVKGTVAGKIDEITEIFGRVEPISLPSVPGEFAFITKSMKEADFAAKAEKLADDMLGRIRVFF
jgi:homoserine dehydrogenase